MSQNFSKPLQKQRLDFYLERIQKMCLEEIDSGMVADGHSALSLIKNALGELEKRESLRFASRRRELESMKSSFRNLELP